jgi:N-acetylglucosamine kinase-like BadF-type ATPase
MSADVILGVDGGGTQTTALLADKMGHGLGRGTAGSSNYHAVGAAAALEALGAAVAAAFADARLEFHPPRAACFGLAGADRPADQALIRGWAERQWPGISVRVVNDAELTLVAGTPHGWGIAVICGTGSIAWGRSREGGTARAGGWGWALGDEGSGFAIGLAALQAMARAADGRGPRTALTKAILSHWSLPRPEMLVGRVYQTPFPRHAIASLAPLIETVAGEGDETATAILREAGRELAQAAAAVARALQLEDPIPTALGGSVLTKGRRVRAALEEALGEWGLTLAPVECVSDPAQGAVILARELVSG